MTRSKTCLAALCAGALLLTAGRAESTPSFDLYISTGGITHLAVGQTLQLRAYLPEVRRDSSKPTSPLSSPVKWRTEPTEVASVSANGVLTALQAGQVRILVEATDVPAGELPPGLPGSGHLTIVKELPGGRLPRLEGLAAFEGFRVEWDRSGYNENRGIGASLQTFEWSVGITTKAPPAGPLPWTLDAVAERSQFNDDRGYQDLLSEVDSKRWQANLLSARLIITSWRDGVAGGRFEAKTKRGVTLDTPFHAWFEDRNGVLARAAAGQGSRAGPTIVLYEWPLYVKDVDPAIPGDQPGFDIKAPNPYGGSDLELRQIRVHVTPGTKEDGSLIRVMGVHFQGPPGAELAAYKAYVSQSHVGWAATRSHDGTSYSFHAGAEPVPMPETGLVFIFLATPEGLEKARWRDVRVLLTNDAADGPPRAESIVGVAYYGGEPTDARARYPIKLPYGAGD